MATYFMFGRYSSDAVRKIGAERTKDTIALIEKHGEMLGCMSSIMRSLRVVITLLLSVERMVR
jgi:hypothetical protein